MNKTDTDPALMEFTFYFGEGEGVADGDTFYRISGIVRENVVGVMEKIKQGREIGVCVCARTRACARV